MYGIWKLRVDLQKAFSLRDIESQASYVIWFISQAPLEYQVFQLRLDQLRKSYLNSISIKHLSEYKYPFTVFMELVACARGHAAFPVKNSTSESRLDFVMWFYKDGMESFGFPPSLLLPLFKVFNKRSPASLLRASQKKGLLTGLIKEAVQAIVLQVWDSLIEFVLMLKHLRVSVPQVNLITMKLPQIIFNKHKLPNNKLGVTVVGPVRGTYGIAQHARLVSLALHSTEFPTEVFNYAPSFSQLHNESSTSEIERLITKRPNGVINLFAMNADFFLGLNPNLVNKLGMREKKNILYGYWELPNFPQPWLEMIDMFDEIWAPSHFIKQSLEKGLNREIIHMPPPVNAFLERIYARTEFGLPDKKFLFLFTYDSYSHISRKNPLAVIKAFSKAFPRTDNSVGLVIKVNNHKHEFNQINYRVEKEMEDLIASDNRIRLIDQELSRNDFCGLISLCDSYVSLHRSEGFGYGMAEATMLGKPVIATNYSGNVDFTTPATAFLVDYELIPVSTGEYPFADGQYWAKPNIDHAAYQMQVVASDAELRRKVSSAGQQFINDNYGIKAAGQRLSARLEIVAAGQQRHHSLNINDNLHDIKLREFIDTTLSTKS